MAEHRAQHREAKEAEPAKPDIMAIDFNAAASALAKMAQYSDFIKECQAAISVAQSVRQDVEYLKSQSDAARSDLREIEAEKTKQFDSIQASKDAAELAVADIRKATEEARRDAQTALENELAAARKTASDLKSKLTDEIAVLLARKESAEKLAVETEGRLSSLQGELKKLRSSTEEIFKP